MNWEIWKDNNYRANFYNHVKRYDYYRDQEQRIQLVLSEFGVAFKSMLDVGCGDFNCRFKKVLQPQEYTGIDINFNDFDITKTPWDLGKFDLVFASLTLSCLDDSQAQSVFDEMVKHSKKFVFIYESSQEADDKMPHDYESYNPKQLVASGAYTTDKDVWYLWDVTL